MANTPEEADVDVEREHVGLERERLDIERARLEIERVRSARDNRFLVRHIGELIAASIALAGVAVSGANIWVASIQKEKELAQGRIQKERELEQQRIAEDGKLSLERLEDDHRSKQDERDYDYKWKLDMMQFLERHSGDVFCEDSTRIKRARQIMLAAFPPDEVGQLFVRLQGSAESSIAKESWKAGSELANKMVNAHVYVHIRTPAQAQSADALTQRLRQLGLQVVGTEVAAGGPRVSQLMYFRGDDEQEAKQLTAIVKDFLPDATPTIFSGQETRVLPRHYEVWFPPAS